MDDGVFWVTMFMHWAYYGPVRVGGAPLPVLENWQIVQTRVQPKKQHASVLSASVCHQDQFLFIYLLQEALYAQPELRTAAPALDRMNGQGFDRSFINFAKNTQIEVSL